MLEALPAMPERRRTARRSVARPDSDRRRGQGTAALRRWWANPLALALMLGAVLLILSLAALRQANVRLAPLYHDDARIAEVAELLAEGRAYRVRDTGIAMGVLHAARIAAATETPDLALYGDGAWREAGAALVPGMRFFNAQMPGAGYQGALALTAMFLKAERLPPRMIISIDDAFFTPSERRGAAAGLAVISHYQEMTARLGIAGADAASPAFDPRLSDALSLPRLKASIALHRAAQDAPHASDPGGHPTLDTLMPDGSLRLSVRHEAAFTQQAAREDALSLAEARRGVPPVVGAAEVEDMDRLLGFLVDEGVAVYLAHPPFHPALWEAVQDTPYRAGLRNVEALTRRFSDRYALPLIGSFDPAEAGCDSGQFRDGAHAGPRCLGLMIDRVLELDAQGY